MSAPLPIWQTWLPRQRWFAGKGRPASVVSESVLELDRRPDLVVRVHLVGVGYDGSTEPSETYQVPVVLRRKRAGRKAVIGTVREDDGSTWYVYDGPHDPAFTSVLLGVLADARTTLSRMRGDRRTR